MLKIKDNVNLKELEKFGFKYKKNEYRHKIYEWTNKYDFFTVYVWDNREIYSSGAVDVLYDLIKADLVEKVVVR